MYYLTIQETEVDPGETQRRPGLHVDNPGTVTVRGTEDREGAQGQEGAGASHKYRGQYDSVGECR